MLHACNRSAAQRGKNGNGFSREHWLLRQSERGAWRRPSRAKTEDRWMMMDVYQAYHTEREFVVVGFI